MGALNLMSPNLNLTIDIRNGVIDIREWTTKMREITDLSASDLAQLWSSIDTNSDGVLNQNEFVLLQARLLSMKQKKEEKLKFLWRCFDIDGDGRLSSEEFHIMMNKMNISPQDANILVRLFRKEAEFL